MRRVSREKSDKQCFPSPRNCTFSFSLPSEAELSGKHLQNLFSNQRPSLVIRFSCRNFLPREHPSFFFSFFFLLQDWESTCPLLKRKKKSHPGKSRVGRLGVLTISPWSIFIVLSFFLFGFKVLWYYEKQQKSFYINHLSAKMTDARRRRESMVLALKLQQKEGFVNFQQGRILLQVLAPLLSILPQKKIN